MVKIFFASHKVPKLLGKFHQQLINKLHAEVCIKYSVNQMALKIENEKYRVVSEHKILTAVAPLKMKLSQKFRHLMRCKKYFNKKFFTMLSF